MSRTPRRPSRPVDAPRRVIGYLRVSTTGQAEHGVSLDAQRAKVEGYAALYGLELVAVLVDGGASASTLDRPELARALSMLRTGEADALLVAKLDRLTRSVRDLGDLVDTCNREGWALLSVADQLDTASAAGRLVMNILASVGQWEREAIGERTRDALRAKAGRGELVGSVPYGFRLAEDGKNLLPEPAEQAALEQARELRASGLSLRAVAAELDRLGFVSRAGSRFHAKQVSRMVAHAA